MLNHSAQKCLVCINEQYILHSVSHLSSDCSFFFSFSLFLRSLLSSNLRPVAYHVFSFKSIRPVFVIMQIREHGGNLIRVQIWFHVKDCLRVGLGGGIWSHNIEQPNYVQYLFSQWAATRTRHSFIGLRFAVVFGGLKLTALHKVWLSFVLPRDAEWKLQLMGSISISAAKHSSLCLCIFIIVASPRTEYPSAPFSFVPQLNSQKMGSL